MDEGVGKGRERGGEWAASAVQSSLSRRLLLYLPTFSVARDCLAGVI